MTDLTDTQKEAIIQFHNTTGGMDAVAALVAAFGLDNTKANRMAVYEMYKANRMAVLAERQARPTALGIPDDVRAKLADAEEPIIVEQGDYDVDVARLLAGDEDGSMDIKTLLVPPEVLPPVSIATADVAKDVKEPFLLVRPTFDQSGNRVTITFELRNKKDCGC